MACNPALSEIRPQNRAYGQHLEHRVEGLAENQAPRSIGQLYRSMMGFGVQIWQDPYQRSCEASNMTEVCIYSNAAKASSWSVKAITRE